MEVMGKPWMWRFQQESLASFPFEMLNTVLCTYSQVSWEQRSFRQSLELSQSHQVGKQAKDKGLGIIYIQEPQGRGGAGPAGSSAPQLFCSPKLVDQSAEGGKKKTRNKNQAMHKVILTVSLNFILCKATGQPWNFSQIRSWVWCLYLVSCA